MFITFEGGEGSGKSTQVRLLSERLVRHGCKVTMTREPGGTEDAEAVRNIFVSGETGRWSSDEELLLVSAARSNHLRNLIRPALLRGEIVICDRFIDSTYVYQVFAGTTEFDYFDKVSRHVIGETWPVKTFILDIDPVEGILRSRNRMAALKIASEEYFTAGIEGLSQDALETSLKLSAASSEDRFERKDIKDHKKIREGFASLVQKFPDRCVLLDATKSPDILSDTIWQQING